MARSKSPSGYPLVYRKIIETVLDTQNEMRIKQESLKAAQNLRFRFYEFMEACRTSKDTLEYKLGEDSRSIMIRVSGDEKAGEILFMKRDRTLESIGLEEALRQFEEELKRVQPDARPSSTSYTPQEDEQESLLQKIGYIKGKGDKK